MPHRPLHQNLTPMTLPFQYRQTPPAVDEAAMEPRLPKQRPLEKVKIASIIPAKRCSTKGAKAGRAVKDGCWSLMSS